MEKQQQEQEQQQEKEEEEEEEEENNDELMEIVQERAVAARADIMMNNNHHCEEKTNGHHSSPKDKEEEEEEEATNSRIIISPSSDEDFDILNVVRKRMDNVDSVKAYATTDCGGARGRHHTTTADGVMTTTTGTTRKKDDDVYNDLVMAVLNNSGKEEKEEKAASLPAAAAAAAATTAAASGPTTTTLEEEEEEEEVSTTELVRPPRGALSSAVVGVPGAFSVSMRGASSRSLHIDISSDEEEEYDHEAGGEEEEGSSSIDSISEAGGEQQEDNNINNSIDNNNNNNVDNTTEEDEELAVATPIDDSTRLWNNSTSRTGSSSSTRRQQTATPFHHHHATTSRGQQEWKKDRTFIVLGGCILLVLLLSIAAAVTIGIQNKNKNKNNGTTSKNDESSSYPGSTTTASPSPAPTVGVMDILLRDHLPEYTLQNLEIYGTPQSKAWEWLRNHPNLHQFEEVWRMKQLFALATFFYSFGGEHWNPLIRERWLDYNKEECLWFSNAFGWFDEDGNYGESPPEVATSSCNTTSGEFQKIYLQNLLLPDTVVVSIPPQIALLTSLKSISLGWSNIHASLHNNILPTELFTLTNLTDLAFPFNKLTGTIPSDIGRLTNLVDVNLWWNKLSGTIPSQLGLIKSLNSIILENNTLSSTIPEGLCSLGSHTFNPTNWKGLSFDCFSDELCGCCWCPCTDDDNGNYSSSIDCQETNHIHPNDVNDDDDEWPGAFPTTTSVTGGSNNTIAINVHTDNYPEETSFDWSVLLPQESGGLEWEVLESHAAFDDQQSLYSYTVPVQSDSLHRLRMFDSGGEGFCCRWGLGWLTITNSTPSQNHGNNGTVMFDAMGNALEYTLDVFIWVDSSGNAQVAEYIPGDGYALEGEEQLMIVVPDVANQNSTSSEIMDESEIP